MYYDVKLARAILCLITRRYRVTIFIEEALWK